MLIQNSSILLAGCPSSKLLTVRSGIDRDYDSQQFHGKMECLTSSQYLIRDTRLVTSLRCKKGTNGLSLTSTDAMLFGMSEKLRLLMKFASLHPVNVLAFPFEGTTC